MVLDFDDFGANCILAKDPHECRSHDCRSKLDELKVINPEFKVTLFTIPSQVTLELAHWAAYHKDWVELAVHGYWHTSNYECEKWTYEEAEEHLRQLEYSPLYSHGFKAPGWQISTETLQWLSDNGWWVADQDYNSERRPQELPAYINRNGEFFAHNGDPKDDWTPIEAWHGHTWDCVGNGIYETFDQLSEIVKNAKDFQFVSEVLV